MSTTFLAAQRPIGPRPVISIKKPAPGFGAAMRQVFALQHSLNCIAKILETQICSLVDQWSMVVNYHPIDLLRINLEGRYVGSRFDDVNNLQPMGAFDVGNVSANYDVTNRGQTYVRVDNIFDEKYEEIRLFGTPGRSIFVGLRVNYDAKP
ncbi:MAG: hypothetical protein ABI604_06345 [Nitrospirota bacterium]